MYPYSPSAFLASLPDYRVHAPAAEPPSLRDDSRSVNDPPTPAKGPGVSVGTQATAAQITRATNNADGLCLRLGGTVTNDDFYEEALRDEAKKANIAAMKEAKRVEKEAKKEAKEATKAHRAKGRGPGRPAKRQKWEETDDEDEDEEEDEEEIFEVHEGAGRRGRFRDIPLS